MVSKKWILLCDKLVEDRNCSSSSENLPHSTEKCARVKRWHYVTEGWMDGQACPPHRQRLIMVVVTDTALLTQQLLSRRYGASWILRMSELSIHVVSYTNIEESSKGKCLQAVRPQQDCTTACAILLPFLSHRSFFPPRKNPAYLKNAVNSLS